MRDTHQSFWRFLPLVALLLSIGGAIFAYAYSSVSASSLTAASSSPTPTSSTHFKIGDQVKAGKTWVVTINSATLHGPTDFDKPKPGDTYLVVDVTFRNVSAQPKILSTRLQMSLKDARGQTCDEAIVTFISGSPDGPAAAGDVLRGQVVYEVPKGQKSFTLAFEPDIANSAQFIWDINV